MMVVPTHGTIAVTPDGPGRLGIQEDSARPRADSKTRRSGPALRDPEVRPFMRSQVWPVGNTQRIFVSIVRPRPTPQPRIPTLPMNRPICRQVLECASPLALSNTVRANRTLSRDSGTYSRTKSGRGLPHSKTLARDPSPCWLPMNLPGGRERVVPTSPSDVGTG